MTTIGGQMGLRPTADRERDSVLRPTGRDTVVVALAYPSSRRGVRIALEHHGFAVVAEAGTAEQAVAAALEHRPRLCLIDLEMPGGGVQATTQILAELEDTTVAIMTASLENPQLYDAVRAGANGCLLKGTAPDRLTISLRALLDGEVVLPRILTERLVGDLRRRTSVEPDVSAEEVAPADADLTDAQDGAPAPEADLAHPALGKRSRLLYIPRLLRHFRRRRRGGMPTAEAWASARIRMRGYS
jgi:DNA-binding NarL/FixJ family response regulator